MINRKYILKRIVLMVFSIFAVATILFFLFRQVPGGPETMMAGGALPEDVRQRIIEQHGLDEPLWKQYISFIANGMQGDFGQSFYHGRPVVEVVTARLANTLSLMVTALLLAYGIAVYVGSHLAWIRGTKLERVEIIAVMLARGTPVFWTGLVLLYIFSFKLGWFPVGGLRSSGAVWSSPAGKFLSTDFLFHLVLPVAAITIFYTGFPALLMRNNMLEVLTEGYISTAQAKGLSERRIVLWHAARNAILPIVTAFAVAMGYAIGGQVLIETVFSWPGLGKEMVDSATRNDYPTAQATFLLLATLVIVMNFFADMIYSYLDPRIEVGLED